MDEARKIAAGLTEAQRRGLRDPYGYADQFDNGRVRLSLISMGLIESGRGLRVSPLGLRVRAVLQESSE